MNRLSVFPLLLLLAAPAPAAEGRAAARNVLFVGNSLSYVNNLPALYATLAATQAGQPGSQAGLIAAPGGTIAERWKDGVTARQIEGGHWQVLVLQERGGLLACLATMERRGGADCMASVAAHRKFAKLAQARGMRVILLGTWGPDAIWQGQLSRGLRTLAKGANAEVVDTGPPVRAYAKAHPQTAMYTDQVLHPTLDASLLMAAALYQQIAGRAPQVSALDVTAPLLPTRSDVRADALLSAQTQIAGDGSITHIDAARLQPLIEAAEFAAALRD